MRSIIRQGDVLMIRVASLPQGTTPRAPEAGRVVLAHGEATGHAHVIEDASVATLFDSDAGTFVRLDADSRLVHDEHDPIAVDAGVYHVIRQREYTPEAIVNVAD